MEVRNKVRSVCYDMDVAKISVLGIPDKPGIAASLFVALAKAGISVDTIVQNSSVNKIADLTFTVTKDQIIEAMKVAKPIAKKLGASDIVADSELGKVSIVGTGSIATPIGSFSAQINGNLGLAAPILPR